MFGPGDMESQIHELIYKLIGIGVAAAVCAGANMYFFLKSAARQVRKLREAYVRSILRQDISFFDKCKPGSDLPFIFCSAFGHLLISSHSPFF